MLYGSLTTTAVYGETYTVVPVHRKFKTFSLRLKKPSEQTRLYLAMYVAKLKTYCTIVTHSIHLVDPHRFTVGGARLGFNVGTECLLCIPD